VGFEHPHLGAAFGELVRDGKPDQPGADDDDHARPFAMPPMRSGGKRETPRSNVFP